MLTRLFHTDFLTGPVPVRLDVYRDDGQGPRGAAAVAAASGTSVAIEAAPGTKLRVERGETTYGLPVYASFLEAQLRDPGLIRETFRGSFRETAFLAVLSAPAHVTEAGTEVPAFVWYGLPMRAHSVPTIAPAVYPEGSPGGTTLRIYDGLAALSHRNGAPATHASLARVVAEPVLRVNRHLPLYMALDAFPPEAIDAGGAAYTRRDPRNLRFGGELSEADARRGDFGMERDQVERALEGLGLVLYQHTTPDATNPEGGPDGTGGPSWRIVPRSGMGGQLLDVFHASGYEFSYSETGVLTSEYTATDTNILPDAVTLDAEDLGGTDADVAEEVEAAAAVKLTGSANANLVRTPFPLGVDGTVSERLVTVSPTPGVFVRFSATSVFDFEGRARIRLEGTDDDGNAVTYWLGVRGGSDTGPFTFGWVTEPAHMNVGTDDVTRVAEEEVPVVGDLWVDWLDQEDGDDAVFVRTEVGFVDANGDTVTDWVVTVNPDPSTLQEGETVTLRRPTGIEVLGAEAGATWRTPSAWESVAHREGGIPSGSPLSFSTLGSYLAHDRLAQQGRPLAAPKCTVEGLHGPGRLLRFPAANLGREGPFGFVLNVPCVVGGGLVLDLDAGTTEGGWTELTTNALTEGSEASV